MASVSKDPRVKGTGYRVSYRRPDGSKTSKGGFKLKRDAQAFADSVEVSKRQGAYIAERDALITVGALGRDWIAAHAAAVKPSTAHSDESDPRRTEMGRAQGRLDPPHRSCRVGRVAQLDEIADDCETVPRRACRDP